MPRVSVYIIRTALIQLALGVTIGGLLLADKGLHVAPWLWTLRPGHIQIMIMGWTVQLACGVAIWIFPRFDASGGRGNLGLVWLGYATLNSGVALATLYLPLSTLNKGLNLTWMPPLAGLLYLIAVTAMVAHLWRRVLSFRTLARP